MTSETINNIEFTQINNDTNGNPRFVFHFLELANTYPEAVKLAKKIGGRKFHNRQYGGGIVIQSYNLLKDSKLIQKTRNNNILNNDNQHLLEIFEIHLSANFKFDNLQDLLFEIKNFKNNDQDYQDFLNLPIEKKTNSILFDAFDCLEQLESNIEFNIN
jgi:hypothetical protein